MAVWAAERESLWLRCSLESNPCAAPGVVSLDADEPLSDTELSKTDWDLLHHALTSTFGGYGRGGDSSLAARFGFLGLYVTDMSVTQCRYPNNRKANGKANGNYIGARV